MPGPVASCVPRHGYVPEASSDFVPATAVSMPGSSGFVFPADGPPNNMIIPDYVRPTYQADVPANNMIITDSERNPPAGSGGFVPSANVPDPVKPAAVPPASVNFVSLVWNNFESSVMPFLSNETRSAVRANRDPKEIGNFESKKMQDEILEGLHSKSHIIFPSTVVDMVHFWLDPDPTNKNYKRHSLIHILPLDRKLLNGR